MPCSQVRGILGLRRFERRELLEDFKRFHNKNFTKKFLKSKGIHFDMIALLVDWLCCHFSFSFFKHKNLGLVVGWELEA